LTSANSTLGDELAEIKKHTEELEENKNTLYAELTTCKNEMEIMSTENVKLKSDIEKLKSDPDELKIKLHTVRRNWMKNDKKNSQGINRYI
jgi:regulator of replication initiation timing